LFGSPAAVLVLGVLTGLALILYSWVSHIAIGPAGWFWERLEWTTWRWVRFTLLGIAIAFIASLLNAISLGSAMIAAQMSLDLCVGGLALIILIKMPNERHEAMRHGYTFPRMMRGIVHHINHTHAPHRYWGKTPYLVEHIAYRERHIAGMLGKEMVIGFLLSNILDFMGRGFIITGLVYFALGDIASMSMWNVIGAGMILSNRYLLTVFTDEIIAYREWVDETYNHENYFV
jgi:hypothetical protein